MNALMEIPAFFAYMAIWNTFTFTIIKIIVHRFMERRGKFFHTVSFKINKTVYALHFSKKAFLLYFLNNSE